ncbi:MULTISPECIES: UDP binding domain-containing protein [Corynebacterium]|uniref:UDP binding domain-containing protein n=1 Tax=Corynebacterium TaxID=1716 RepID=UPI001EF1EFA7|nr:UDP binding domain-containing protein [Corynebacterium kefirresidentii]MCG7241868.1 NAD(P)-binding domain-containing protein [Corynebacterium kefirresidentii]
MTARIAAELPEKQVLVVEPNIQELPTGLANKENVKLSSAKEAIEAAEVITLLVDHDEFKSINPSLLKGKTIIDTKGLWK